MGIRPANNRKILSRASGERVMLSREVTVLFPRGRRKEMQICLWRGFSSKAGCKQNILNQPKATGLFIIIRVDLIGNRCGSYNESKSQPKFGHTHNVHYQAGIKTVLKLALWTG